MTSTSEIKSEKIVVKDVFKLWFTVPEYQRPYVWGNDEIHDLLNDLCSALLERANSEYFLGSFVFQAKPADPESGQEFLENDLLDGQQRMATLLLLMAVIRDLSDDPDIKENCQKYIHQKANRIENIPERDRILFNIREKVQDFIGDYINLEGGTNSDKAIDQLAQDSPDTSVRNMANAVRVIREFFKANPVVQLDELLPFVVNNVLMIYVATEELEDAFRLFTILNARGIPLRNSDILKSMNLGALEAF